MSKKQKVSFEFFPPKTPEAETSLWYCINELQKLGPTFVSITYGAGGSTKDFTFRTIKRLIEETSLKPAAHLTSAGTPKDEIDSLVNDYWKVGLRHIVALRGDIKNQVGRYIPSPGTYAYSDNLVSGLKKLHNFEISVAAYPETHPEALSPEADIEHLKRKFDAGADRAITQYFFEADTYFRFMDKISKSGIKGKIVPGVINIAGYEQIVRFSKLCKSEIPGWMHHKLEPIKDNPEETKKAAIEISQKICSDLVKGGVDQFHIYTMNKTDMTQQTCEAIGV